MDTLIATLASDFPVKDLDALSYFLGIEVHRSDNGLILSQKKYIQDLLLQSNMSSTKPISSSLASTTQLSAHMGDMYSDPNGYHSIVSGLQYLSFTRPDLAFAFVVNKVC